MLHDFMEKMADFAENSQKFLGQILLKNDGLKTADFVGNSQQISLESDWFCTDLTNGLN